MDKNYYDILQINRNASPEIIEKAYKTLAKKYHPDLQKEEDKKQSEAILKDINEAYETLSNLEKKQAYDNTLKQQEASYASAHNNQNINTDNNSQSTQQELLYRKQQELKRQQQLQQEQLYKQQLQREQELAYQEQLQQARQKAYHDAYIQDLKNRGYRIRYKKSFKDYVRGFISIIAVIVVFIILWQIPFIKNFFIKFYEEKIL